ncbi:GIY-YIG nuclease family protein [uncultured Sphingomonas sp.]|uniref:GIY-YIG nuclease family protein n=1 Tax=uncultured Sphingomonas sp. TaxID=158754 RepID=UPI0035C9A04C
MPFHAYLLHCNGGSFYAGHTDNLEVRLAQHERGDLPGYTRDHLPVTLVWSQDFPRGWRLRKPSVGSRVGAGRRSSR